MSTFQNAFSLLQKIGKRMMLPVSVLPVAGILLGIGSANFSWLPQTLSQVMAASGSAIFGNLPLLFAIGVSPSGSRTMTASLRLPAPWAMSSSSDRWVFSRSSLASRRPT